MSRPEARSDMAPSGYYRGVLVLVPGVETVDGATGVATCRLSMHEARGLLAKLTRAVEETDQANAADEGSAG